MSRPRPGLLSLLLAATTAGCALLACRPLGIVVADKEERVRLELVPVGLRTTEVGRLEEVEALRRVRTHWVRSKEGQWYPVPPSAFATARVGEHAAVCR